MSEQGNKPFHEFRAGNVRAAVWRTEVQQEGQTVIRYSIKTEKRYRDQDGEWRSSDYYFPDEIPRMLLVSQKAGEYVVLKESSPNTDAGAV